MEYSVLNKVKILNLQDNIETYSTLIALIITLTGSYLIVRNDWKRYGMVFLLTGVVGNILCYLFIKLGFYSFPYRLFPSISIMPFETILTLFPFYVVLGVRYSPQAWAFKIAFYFGIVHFGMFKEVLAESFSDLIRYDYGWDVWDSYTWWWIFLLMFDYIGGLIVPEHLRKPITLESFRYGNWLWLILHFIIITTIFLGGYYLGFEKFQ